MNSRIVAAVLCSAVLATSAIAGKVHNKSSKAQELKIKCGSSTSTGSIQSGTVRDLGSGTCTVTVKAIGASSTVGPNDTFVIPK